jgi:hypothetical protein
LAFRWSWSAQSTDFAVKLMAHQVVDMMIELVVDLAAHPAAMDELAS